MEIPKTPGIYQWRNLINGKIYIGSSINLYRRKNSGHLRELRKNTHPSGKFQNAWNVHGEENFIFEILELILRLESESDLDFKSRLVDIREQHYLDTLLFASEKDNRFYELGYNTCRIADSTLGSTKQKNNSETKQKKSKAALNWYKENPELKQGRTDNKSSNWHKQKKFECEYCKKDLQQSLIKRHRIVCKLNPNRIQFTNKSKGKIHPKEQIEKYKSTRLRNKLLNKENE